MRSTRLLSSSKRLLGLDPLPVPPHSFSLDGDRLRYGRFGRAEGAFEFQEFHEVPLEPGTFHPGPLGGTVRDAEMLRERLETLLEALTQPVTEASLVLPDAWLRLVFAEFEELPRRFQDAEEVLRWKLKKLVPFRVDELRLRGIEVQPLAGRDGRRRVLLGYAMEVLLSQLEDVFAARGVRVGLVVNCAQSLCAALSWRAPADRRVAFIQVTDAGYSLLFSRGGRPLFHRFRAIGGRARNGGAETLVRRDLKLTRDFLIRETAESAPEGFLVVAGPEDQERWRGWVQEAFEVEAVVLRPQHLPLRGDPPEPRLPEISLLLGAACHQV